MQQRISIYHYEGAQRVLDSCGVGQLDYELEHNPPSIVLVCHQCGWDWCRMIPLFDDQHIEAFHVVRHLCRACGNGCLSNLRFQFREFTIPDELLADEIERYATRQIHEYDTFIHA